MPKKQIRPYLLCSKVGRYIRCISESAFPHLLEPPPACLSCLIHKGSQKPSKLPQVAGLACQVSLTVRQYKASSAINFSFAAMSQAKINGKNLHYDQSLPPFLARLRGQATIDSQSPDPILAARRRPAKQRSGSEEAEDAPLVVDESGNVVSSVSVERDGTVKEIGTKSNEHEGAMPSEADDGDDERRADPVDPVAEKVASIGGAKKRKAGRIVGGGGVEEADQGPDQDQGPDCQPKASKKIAEIGKHEKREANRPVVKGKKKVKKIKLSFGDDDDGD